MEHCTMDADADLAFEYSTVRADIDGPVPSVKNPRSGAIVAHGFGSIVRTTGTLPAVSAAIQALTEPGDEVILRTPAYNCFFSSIRNSRCEVSANPLRYEAGRYTLDFDDLEAKAADPAARLLLCPPIPHRTVWTPDELRRIGDLCRRHGVRVIADEIHCELVRGTHVHTPFASLSEELSHGSVTCLSPGEAFNLAGLQVANVVDADPDIRRRIARAINVNEVCDISPSAIDALIAACERGAERLDALRAYIQANDRYLRDWLATVFRSSSFHRSKAPTWSGSTVGRQA